MSRFLLSASLFLVACDPAIAPLDAASAITKQAFDGGAQAEPGQFAHQVSLQDRGGRHLCGGALVAQNWVVTSARCVDAAERVMSGDPGLHDGRIHGIAEKHVYPGWAGTDHDDIALVELDSSVSAGWIPVLGAHAADRVAEGRVLTASGWGAVGDDSPSASLYYIDVDVLDPGACGDLTADMLCTTSPALEVGCGTDQGGPVVVPAHGDWALAGLTANAGGCYDSSVLTNVGRYTDWMAEHIGDLAVVEDGQEADAEGNWTLSPGAGALTHQAILQAGAVDSYPIELTGTGDLELWTTSSIDTMGVLYGPNGEEIAGIVVIEGSTTAAEPADTVRETGTFIVVNGG